MEWKKNNSSREAGVPGLPKLMYYYWVADIQQMILLIMVLHSISRYNGARLKWTHVIPSLALLWFVFYRPSYLSPLLALHFRFCCFLHFIEFGHGHSGEIGRDGGVCGVGWSGGVAVEISAEYWERPSCVHLKLIQFKVLSIDTTLIKLVFCASVEGIWMWDVIGRHCSGPAPVQKIDFWLTISKTLSDAL